MAMEVFTISGSSGFGAGDVIWRNPQTGLEETHPPGWKPPTQAYAVTRTSGGSAGSPPVALQNAIKALGATHGDSALDITVDGAIGPGTVKALNHALSAYIGAGPLKAAGLTAPQFMQARVTKADAMKYAGALAAIVANTVRQHGGFVPPPPSVVGSSRSSSAMRSKAEALIQDNSQTASAHPYLVWIVGGVALLVAFVGFTAAKRRANA